MAVNEDTRALIEEDVREGTFVTTQAVTDGLLLLKQNGVLLITGHAGTGKSRIGRHILQMYCTENKSLKCMKLTLADWENLTNRDENLNNGADIVVLLFDDIFGETNCIYNREKDTPVLDKVHAYVCKGKIKVIVTIRDTVKRQCQDLFDSHRLFRSDFIDFSSDKYLLSSEEKINILLNYIKTVRQLDIIGTKGFLDYNGDTILDENEVRDIIRENPVKGFPLLVYQFVHNDKYFHLGRIFFDRPTEAMLEELNELRREGEDHTKFKIQYAVMVYTVINENCINPDDSSTVTEVAKIIDAIYGQTIELKKCKISDAVNELIGSYFIKIPNQRSYKLHHPTLQESVILSFAQIDEANINKIVPLISLSFFLKMVKPESYKEKNGEIVLKIPTNSYQIFADRLVDIYVSLPKTDSTGMGRYLFSYNLIKTEIFQQQYFLLLPLLLKGLEKEDKDYLTDCMIISEDWYSLDYYPVNTKKKDIFLKDLLNKLAILEKQLDTYNFVLKIFKTIIKTSSSPLTINYMISALMSSLYEICSTKDVKNVKATLDIIEENKIPVLLDQGVELTDIPSISASFLSFDAAYTDDPCVFLTLCIWNAYKAFNIPVLEFLLSKYNQIPFDINLFFKMIYSEKWIKSFLRRRKTIFECRPSLSFKPLKWMIQTFKDQGLNETNLILRTACKYQMIDTVEYLASGCKTFDVGSCLQAFIDNLTSLLPTVPLNQELFNFLIKKVAISSKELIPVVMSAIQTDDVPDYIFYALLPVCINDANILILACNNGQFYLVKLIIESSHISHLDIQSALIAACKGTEKCFFNFCYHDKANIETKKLNIVKYIVEEIGFEQFDLKAVCQQACDSKKIKIIKWLVQNIDITRLDVYVIINSALVNNRSDILKQIMKNIELESLDKRKVLRYLAEHYTAICSTTIFEILSTIWNSTQDKKVLQMDEIVKTAYERKSVDLLAWIHYNCRSQISIDPEKLLLLACENNRVDVAKWVFQTFEQTSFDIDGGKLFIIACSKTYNDRDDETQEMVNKLIGTLTWILATFQIKEMDIISCVLEFLNVDRTIRNELYNLAVSLFEKYLINLKAVDMKVILYKSLETKCYNIVNWFLENENCCSFDKQKILNKACADIEIETVKMLIKYFFALDLNQAMYHAFNASDCSFETELSNDHKKFTCLDLLLKEIDQDSYDISTLVSTFCQEEYVIHNTMTWILLNIPHDRIPVNKVLIKCCQTSKIDHVKYIFHEVDNKQLEVEQSFVEACSWWGKSYVGDMCVIDFLFQNLQDKASSLLLVLELFLQNSNLSLILYFLQAGYYRNIDMKNLLNLACRDRHSRLVQWILGNVEHKDLDIISAFREAYKFQDRTQVQCVAIIWHYIQDMNMFEKEIVLKTMTELDLGMSNSDSYDNSRSWLLYTKNIHQRMICKSESIISNIGENKTQHNQQVNDRQCCLEDPNSRNEHDDMPSPM